MELTQHQADAFARMPLTYLRQEYPNHIMHLLNDDGDVLPPRELHPVFYGCFDWHSAVHGYWLLAAAALPAPLPGAAVPGRDRRACRRASDRRERGEGAGLFHRAVPRLV